MNKADVIERLEEMETYLRNKSYSDLKARDYCEWVGYALALLREQEPVEPHVEHDSDDDSWYYGCGACHEAIDYMDKFCRHCGREVKWDAAD